MIRHKPRSRIGVDDLMVVGTDDSHSVAKT
ncbi:MAG: hypothetical protein RJA81_821 [Planctomycetota bacterium]